MSQSHSVGGFVPLIHDSSHEKLRQMENIKINKMNV